MCVARVVAEQSVLGADPLTRRLTVAREAT